MTNHLDQLETEQMNPNSLHIDEMTTIDIITTMNNEDKTIALAVEKQISAIARAVDCIHHQMLLGGRLIYIGAGTSGRLGVLDASECPPTFGVDEHLVKGIIAGGEVALTKALESVEDSLVAAKEALQAIHLTELDVVCGLASSGKTPYVLGGLAYSQSIGCKTISISCVSNALVSSKATYPIEVVTGPEVVTGSTRMKAGTAQKMVLNMLSTASMIKLGKVYGNLMVDVQPTNQKLKQRSLKIVMQSIDCNEEKAKQLLDKTKYCVKEAILMGLTGLDQRECEKILQENHQHIANAIKSVKK